MSSKDSENCQKSFGSVPLLDMLAEVASATLKSDPVLLKDSPQKVRKASMQADILTLDQIRALSDRMLLDMFSELTSNEIKRIFSYRCYLMPETCTETFSSFGNENRARLQMKSHLLTHIAKLLRETAGMDQKSKFTAEPIQARRRRLMELDGGGRRKRRGQAKKVAPVKPERHEKRKIKVRTAPPPQRDTTSNGTHKDLHHRTSQRQVAQPASEEKPIVEDGPRQLVLQDHSYAGNGRKACLPEDDESDSDMEELCGDEVESRTHLPPHMVIATPAFPYVYVPLLPNTSSILEVAEQEDESSVKSEDESESEPEAALEAPRPQEMRSPRKFADRRAPDSADYERRLALKHIRALRSKRKDERGPLVCKICKTKMFTAQATLMYHYRSHAGIKPFNCKICEATFTRQHSLNYHMLIHNNKSRFACDDCGRNFRHPSHFKEHLRRHTGETPYECADCKQRFKTRNTYKRHLKTRHNKILTAQGIVSLGDNAEGLLRRALRHHKQKEDSWADVACTPSP
ncbi:gastrula zinc finger protein xFG20-1-like isoform X2 [Ornithodoros turicata]